MNNFLFYVCFLTDRYEYEELGNEHLSHVASVQTVESFTPAVSLRSEPGDAHTSAVVGE